MSADELQCHDIVDKITAIATQQISTNANSSLLDINHSIEQREYYNATPLNIPFALA